MRDDNHECEPPDFCKNCGATDPCGEPQKNISEATLYQVMQEYFEKTGQFPGNEYWGKKFEQAFLREKNKLKDHILGD